MSRFRNLVLVSLAAAVVLGFGLLGPLLYRIFIGYDPSGFFAGEWSQRMAPGFPRAIGGFVLFVAGLLAVFAATLWAMRAGRRAPTPGADSGRRRFLTDGAAALAVTAAAGGAAFARAGFGLGNEGHGWLRVGSGIGAEAPTTHPQFHEHWRGARVRRYQRLGRTGFEVSDISLGSSRIRGEAGERLVREALDRGVNYIDTAPDYSAHGSEEAIGLAIQGRRSELFLATKFCTALGHLPAGTPVDRYKAVIEASLQRLGTDYVDLAHVHSCDEDDRLMDENLHEAFDRLRDEGKVRFLGFSSHTPRLVEVADRAILSGRFDVMMLAYHHGIWPTIGDVIARARRDQDMGIVAMKTLKGAKHQDLAGFQQERGAFSQAAFKWVLSNPEVSCLVVSFSEPQHVDEYLHASGQSATERDQAVLRRYDQLVAGTYCAPHCGACLDRCSAGLPIHDVLRHRMYFEDYGWEKNAMELYARLERNAAVCAGCAAPCANACPLGVPIQQRMSEAHDLLSLG